jgi:hypothetical protein
VLGFILVLVLAFVVYFNIVVKVNPPTPDDTSPLQFQKEQKINGLQVCGNNWLQKNEYGLWELYVEGPAFERGVINGLLTQDLIKYQEEAFIREIRRMIPSEFYLRFLRHMIAWFNRDLDEYVPLEYQLEIFGVSQFASEKYNFIGPDYLRILNYHAAHDIGHALQNMNLVGCTAFSAWEEKSSDSSLIVGRNFDFYVGDDFSKNKIIAFVNPKQGYRFMSITWAGMIGVVSGMNEKGLTITLNAAKSEVPSGARTPVSIVARDILQYAGNIDEAIKIAGKYKTFVSESFLIGSATDNKTIVIEKTPNVMSVYDPDTNFIILTNHFQSNKLINQELNIENINNETSPYRLKRVKELTDSYEAIGLTEAASILRNQKGLQGKNIGMGNEKAINQLIAHHSVIFKPGDLKVWVSTNPYQLGPYLCYDLKEIFSQDEEPVQGVFNRDLILHEDEFIFSDAFASFKTYKRIKADIELAINENKVLDEPDILKFFENSNPELFLTYSVTGDYFMHFKDFEKAINYYNLALAREIASMAEREKIIASIKKCKQESKP